MPQRLDCRPLTIHLRVLLVLAERSDPLRRLLPRLHQNRPTGSQVVGIRRPQQATDREPAVQLGLDIRGDFDPVHRQILNQAVDDRVDEHHARHPHPRHERLAEHGVGQIDITEHLRLVLAHGDSVPTRDRTREASTDQSRRSGDFRRPSRSGVREFERAPMAG